MLKKITLENFKAFKKVEIEVKPITILIGPNNGGKTSILQSIGLLKQTVTSNSENIIKFRGDIDLGNFQNILSQHSDSDEIRFNIEFDDDSSFDFNIISNKNGVQVKNFACDNGEFSYSIKNITLQSENAKDMDKYNYEDIEFDISKKSSLFEVLNFKDQSQDQMNFDVFTQNLKKLLKKSHPKIFRENFIFGFGIDLSANSEFSSFIKSTYQLLEQSESKVDVGTRDGNEKIIFKQKRAYFLINFLLNMQFETLNYNKRLKKKFERISYLGPIRYPPRRFYDIGKFKNCGYYGEHYASVLADNERIFKSTKKVLLDWNVLKDLVINRDIDKKIIELKVKTDITENEVNISDVGFGTSQILPIIVESLLSPPDSLILIEQPETHLHPKIQQDFTEFIVKLSKKKNFLIETHSSYIIERLRTLIMKNRISPDNVKIYYVEQNEDKESSIIQEIKIDIFGRYSNLPPNYLCHFGVREKDDQMKIFLKKSKGD
ncbi:MAG: AAA family ATPase [Methanoregula sp.]|nr:AAA family ATPase [Methanoregula sp.]